MARIARKVKKSFFNFGYYDDDGFTGNKNFLSCCGFHSLKHIKYQPVIVNIRTSLPDVVNRLIRL